MTEGISSISHMVGGFGYSLATDVATKDGKTTVGQRFVFAGMKSCKIVTSPFICLISGRVSIKNTVTHIYPSLTRSSLFHQQTGGGYK